MGWDFSFTEKFQTKLMVQEKMKLNGIPIHLEYFFEPLPRLTR